MSGARWIVTGRGKAVLRPRLALTAVATELATLFIGATLPTPLYPLYRTAFGFSGITLTLIYAVYVLGNLAALLFFGRLSDQIGRRPASLPALGIGIVSTLVFLLAESSGGLFLARVLSGFSTGLGAGAATAWIAELQPFGDKARAAGLASAANFAGLAVAPAFSGALAQFAPSPLRLPYLVYLVLLLAAGGMLVAVPETVKERARHLSELDLRPRLGVPREVRFRFIAPAVTAFVTFALIGFYAALIPSLLRDSLGLDLPLTAGLVVFELFLVAVAVALLSTGLREQSAMLAGLGLLVPGLACLLSAELLVSMPLLLTAAALGGIAAALGYRGSLGVVNRIAPDGRRSEVVSSYLVAVYLGNSVPVIGIGLLSETVSTRAAHLTFAGVISLLAVAAFFVGIKYGPTSPSR